MSPMARPRSVRVETMHVFERALEPRTDDHQLPELNRLTLTDNTGSLTGAWYPRGGYKDLDGNLCGVPGYRL